jgi:chromosomal replication initiation ATPase DnaA
VQPGDELGKHDGLTPDPALWHAILDRLDVAPADRDVWLAPTMLAHSGDLLVLACPHKRVGEAIHTRYRAQIDAARSAILGRLAEVEITVKHMPNVTATQRSAWLHAAEQPPYPTWLQDDDQDTLTTLAGCDDGQQQDTIGAEAAT